MKAVIIDDERKSREILSILLAKHCPDVRIVGDADNAADGLELLQSEKPDVAFIDIQMPGESGIEMLKKIGIIDFDIVFVTGHNQFAIEALRLNALDYLLKPINIEELKSAVHKAKKRRDTGLSIKANILNVINSFEDVYEEKHITAHQGEAVHMVKLNDIEYVEAKSNYIDLIVGKNIYKVSKTLAEFEKLIQGVANFVRIDKSNLLNISKIEMYYKTEPCKIKIKSGREFEVSRRKKAEVLNILNNYKVESR